METKGDGTIVRTANASSNVEGVIELRGTVVPFVLGEALGADGTTGEGR